MKPSVSKWSPDETAFLRTNLRGMKRREIARQLGRSYSSVCCKAQVLGLAGDRTWTEQEKLILRSRVAAGDTTPQIMKVLQRTRYSIENMRHKLGLTEQFIVSEDLVSFIREKHAQDWSDCEIVAEWNRLHQGTREGRICRECVSHRRRKLGLAITKYTARQRQRVAEKTKVQLVRAGLPSLSVLHRKVIEDRIAAMGWPRDLRMREAQILNCLWEKGPMTKRDIAAAIGMKLHDESRRMLKSNGRGGNYLQRGLIISFPRIVPKGGKGFNVTLYSLPLSVQRGKVAS